MLLLGRLPRRWPVVLVCLVLHEVTVAKREHREHGTLAVEESVDDLKKTGISAGHALNVALAALAMGAVSVLGSILPSIIERKITLAPGEGFQPSKQVVETACAAFAAGTFWGLALLDILAESVEHLAHAGIGIHYGRGFMNAAYVLVVSGYVFMLSLESVASISNHRYKIRLLKSGSRRKVEENSYFSSSPFAFSSLLAAMPSWDALIPCLALTIHAFFEGLVVGMRESVSLVWVSAISVCGHEWATAFALAQRLKKSHISKSARIFLLALFNLSLPLAALAGIPLKAQTADSPYVGILNAFACGIFIYISAESTAEVFHYGHIHSDHHLKEEEQKSYIAASEGHFEEEHSSADDVSPTHMAKDYLGDMSFTTFFVRAVSFSCGILLILMMTLSHIREGHSHHVDVTTL